MENKQSRKYATRTPYLILASLISGLAGSSQAANLILNGSFETQTPVVLFDDYSVTNVVPSWTVGVNKVAILNNFRGAAAEGDNLVQLDAEFINSTLWQDVTTIAGVSYNLSLQYTPRPGVNTTAQPFSPAFPADTNDVEVWADGVLLATLGGEGSEVDVSGGTPPGTYPTNWTPYTYNFVASGATTKIEFRAAGTADGFGGYIDDVKLSVPEGGSAALLLATGLLGLEGARRRLKALAQA